MDLVVLLFLSSGLFLGWSLGANDASNVFGTAVASRMVTFTTAAIICSVFVILGAVISGAGAAHGLGALGNLNALPGAFMAAFSAALTVFWMTKAGLPVSTTQAVVGAIIGWNLYSGSVTDLAVLSKIIATWVACPMLGAAFAALLYKLTVTVIQRAKIHLLRLDSYTRLGLILAGAFGAYSLGANNIGNVMGVFVSASPFTDLEVGDLFTFSSVQQLFLLGGVAIAVGIFTYSRRVMMTVGSSLLPLNAVAAWVVVVAHSIVLFLFSSIALENLLARNGLPTIPLIPVSSSQAVVGAVIGIGLLQGRKGVRQIRWGVLANIASGWVSTPIISALLCFVSLFILQNVFNQKVYNQTYYTLSAEVSEHLQQADVAVTDLQPLVGQTIAGGKNFLKVLRSHANLTAAQEALVIEAAQLYPTQIDGSRLDALLAANEGYLSERQVDALSALRGQSFNFRWQLETALAAQSRKWKRLPETKVNKQYNQHLEAQLSSVFEAFKPQQADPAGQQTDPAAESPPGGG
jgi:PiT family inorganic phosphate transporter